jgi:hypothetical protein
LVCAVLAAGCGGGERAQDAAPSDRPPLDACALLTSADAEAAMGEPPGEPRAGDVIESDQASVHDCTYLGSSGSAIVLVVRHGKRPDVPTMDPDGVRQALGDGPVTDVPDLGDTAFHADVGGQVQVHVFSTPHYFSVGVSLDDSALAAERGIAASKAVLGRL